MAEWRNGGMAEWQNGGMAEWHNVRYEIVWNQDTESPQMPPWRSPSRLVMTNGEHSLIELLGQVEDSFVSKYSGMLNRIL